MILKDECPCNERVREMRREGKEDAVMCKTIGKEGIVRSDAASVAIVV